MRESSWEFNGPPGNVVFPVRPKGIMVVNHPDKKNLNCSSDQGPLVGWVIWGMQYYQVIYLGILISQYKHPYSPNEYKGFNCCLIISRPAGCDIGGVRPERKRCGDLFV